MFDINPEMLVTKTDKLLYNIQELLKAQAVRQEPIETVEPKKGFDCRFCGGQHESKPQIMACARLKKKAG